MSNRTWVIAAVAASFAARSANTPAATSAAYGANGVYYTVVAAP
jgi:hypothetical protein